DPLADSVPPRHALESDEEDEYNPLKKEETATPAVAVRIVGENLKKGTGLVVTTADAGKYWSRGANLGEQWGAVYVNDIQVGLIFTPTWTSSLILVSEVLTKLPIWAMDSYVRSILEQLQPSNVSLLDTYPVPSYITSEPTLFQNSPIRYLCTETVPSAFASASLTEPFDPPNLLQGTSSMFMSRIAVTPKLKGTLVLLPNPTIPPPAPKTLAPSDFTHISDDRVQWPVATMQIVQDLL
ncbi:hypothetical protein C8J56DRAFT_713154, partial [Mycena floridula]